ncbi:hypothetical protein CIB84_006434, partial [Bambusicola thoracicus]
MNLGDGLKLETEVLDGKPRLILAASDKAKPAMKMGNKARAPKQTLRIRHTGHMLRSTQNACINQENLAKPRSGSSLSVSKGERVQVTKPSSHEATTEDHTLIFQRDITNRKPDSENLNVKENKHDPQNTHISAEDLRSLVCLTQEQLQQILMIVKGGTRHISETPNEKQEEMDEQVALKKKLNETLEGDVVYLWTKSGNDKNHTEKMETADPDKEAVPQEQPFSSLKHEQQKKWLEELDKQKEEAKLRKIEEKMNLSKAEEHDRWAMHFDSLKNHLNTNAQHPLNGMYKKQPESLCLSPDPKELTAFVHPFSPAALGNFMPSKVGNAEKGAKSSALDHSQKTSFLRSMTALLDPAQIEERDRRRQKQLEHQKAIMAQVEEKRKKKQLEEEKRKLEEQEEEQRLAREKERMQKQFEEDMLKQKQKEVGFCVLFSAERWKFFTDLYECSEFNIAGSGKTYEVREKERMQKQFEEDMLKQKQKEELVILKTNELYQTMQKAQELAQRLKQEQRIQDLAQKGHDISKLKKNLGGGGGEFENCNADVSHQSPNFSDDINIDQQTSPRKDTAVQTDDYTTSAYIDTAEERTLCCGSPDISIEYKENSNSKKYQKEMQYTDKNRISAQENGGIYSELYEQYARKERQVKPSEKPGKRPDWNINKPEKRYIPASERYPKPLQKQREENKEEQLHKNHLNEERSDSPPVPAVKNRLQVQQKQRCARKLEVYNNSRREKNTKVDIQEKSFPPPITEAGSPPSSQFIPYVRTNEVYYLDPDAPVTRPSTHDPQYQQFNDSYQVPRQIFSSDHTRDPLLNPDVVKIRERQQAILKGLSELRQ